MRSWILAGGAAAIMGLSVAGTVFAGRPELAGAVAQSRSFACKATAACVTGRNTGTGSGVLGVSASANGIQGNTSAAAASGVYGEADNAAGGIGVAGRTVNGTNSNSLGVLADGGNHGGLPIMIVTGTGGMANMIVAHNFNTGHDTLVLDNQGNLRIGGMLTQCTASCVAAPALEAAGEARLHAGEASVALDPTFSGAIDQRAGYIVLLTPEADTRGLYVARRSPAGFVVRETGDGRSSTPFAYRIVAHPAKRRS